jgi:hypothetical protein
VHRPLILKKRLVIVSTMIVMEPSMKDNETPVDLVNPRCLTRCVMVKIKTVMALWMRRRHVVVIKSVS